MTKKEYEKLNQEILDVMLYNQQQAEMRAKHHKIILEQSKSYLERSRQLRREAEYGLNVADETITNALQFLAKRNINLTFPENDIKHNTTPPPRKMIIPQMSWDDIVNTARNSGIQNATINDILTDSEIKAAHHEYNEIIKEFNNKVHFKRKDWALLIFAVLLQVIRQYFFTSLDVANITVDASEAEKKFKGHYDNGGKLNNRYYYATMDCILNYKTVPYDVTFGSKDFDFAGKGKGIAGTNHRYYTLGHDPALYAIFGTANILTNTLTLYNGRTFHVKYRPNKAGILVPGIVAEANTEKMFHWTLNRLEQCIYPLISYIKNHPTSIIFHSKENSIDFLNMFAPFAALIKAKMHLESDNSKNGLAIPFLEIFTSPERALELSKYGYNAANLNLVLEGATKQASGSIAINFIISMLHGLLCKYEDNEGLIYTEVRTRKILLLSNIIATSSNVIAMSVLAIISAYTQSGHAAEFAYKHLDLGGAIITLYRTMTDLDFIDRVRDEFIQTQMNQKLSKILDNLNKVENQLLSS